MYRDGSRPGVHVGTPYHTTETSTQSRDLATFRYLLLNPLTATQIRSQIFSVVWRVSPRARTSRSVQPTKAKSVHRGTKEGPCCSSPVLCTDAVLCHLPQTSYVSFTAKFAGASVSEIMLVSGGFLTRLQKPVTFVQHLISYFRTQRRICEDYQLLISC